MSETTIYGTIGSTGGTGASALKAIQPFTTNGKDDTYVINDGASGLLITGNLYSITVGDVPQSTYTFNSTDKTVTFDFVPQDGLEVTGTYI